MKAETPEAPKDTSHQDSGGAEGADALTALTRDMAPPPADGSSAQPASARAARR